MEVSPNARWDKCLALIRDNVTEQQYKTWFKPIVFESFDKTTRTVLLQVPSPFVYEYLEENYVDLLRKVLCRCFGEGERVRLSYRVVVVEKSAQGEGTSVVESDNPSDEGIVGIQRSGANQPQTLVDAAMPEIDSQLKPYQTFNNFIEGDSNKLPRAVGLSIAEHPNSSQFNPMFIFGPSGCGKTHLINAIGLRTKQLYPKKRVLYVSARLFQIQFSNARLQNKINDFIHFYQTIDMLIVDDIQEWLTATKTQNTFFHIFDHLFRNGKRIILASDRPPVDLQGMNERLLTRFACGLIAELEKPNVQLCVDILNSKIRHDGLSIPDDVVQYIAHTANGSVRDLEGVVNSLMAFSVVYNCNIDMKLAERVISRTVKTDNQSLSVDEIVETVCNHYHVTTDAVNSRSRKRELVVPRQVSMYLAQKLTEMSASHIGKIVGGRDHSTVIHSCSQVEARLKTDKDFSKELADIEASFRLKR